MVRRRIIAGGNPSRRNDKMTGAEMIIHALRQEGVRALFGYPGGMVIDIFDQLYRSGFPFYLTRHEQGAVHAADGFARASGEVGVCLATSGPGATNLVTAWPPPTWTRSPWWRSPARCRPI